MSQELASPIIKGGEIDSSTEVQVESVTLDIDSRISGQHNIEDKPDLEHHQQGFGKKLKHVLPSRANGKRLPLSADLMPQNDL